MNSANNIKQSKTKLKVESNVESKVESNVESKADLKVKSKAEPSDKDEHEYNKAMLDSILDKKLVKFDNKQQMSMFFIAYKSIDALYKELSESAHYTIPDEIIKRVVLETVPSLIKEYNSNLRKRCRSKNNLDGMDDTICLGRKIDGTQCTRKKYNNNDFCKNHIKKLSNGRVDIPLEESNREDKVPIIVQNQKEHINANANANATLDHNSELVKESVEESKRQSDSLDSLNSLNSLNKINTTKSNVSKPLKTSKRGRKSKIQFDPRQYDNEYVTLWEDIVEGEKVLIDNANNIYTFDLEHPVYIGKKDVTIKLNIKKIIDSLAK